MKKKYITILFLSLLFTACVTSPSVKQENIKKEKKVDKKTLTIDLDKEASSDSSSEGLRDATVKKIEVPIYVGDNDEVSFKGKIMEENSPLTIKVGNRDDVLFSGKSYTIKTVDLSSGDLIIMKDKDGKIFLESEVIR